EYRGAAAITLEAMVDAAGKIIGVKKTVTETDKARNYLNGRGIPFSLAPAEGNAPLVLRVGGATVNGFDQKAYESALAPTGYPKSADPTAVNWACVVALLTVLMIYVTMVYGP